MRTDLFARAVCKARERRPCLSEVRPAAASIGRVPVDSACPCLLVLSRAARKESSASTLPDGTSETLRPRHGTAQAPRYEGCRVLRDLHRDGELEGEHAPSDLASSHIAWNRRRRRTSEGRVAVPAATERWRGHLSHSHPSGHLTPVSRLSRPHRPGTWSAGRGGCPSCPSPPDLPAPRVAHRAPPPRSLFLGTMARHGRRCVTCDYEARWGAFQVIQESIHDILPEFS